MVCPGMEFKFSMTWLDDMDFNTLVRDTWHRDGDFGIPPLIGYWTN